MKLFIIFILSILLCSCQSKKANNHVSIGGESEVYFNSILDSAYVLPLEMKQDFVIGDVSKMNYADSLYFILDRKTHSVYSFNELGKFVGVLNKKGQGPEEYLSIYDFDIDKVNKKIYLLCHPQMIMITDLDFKLDSIIKLNTYFECIAVHDDEVYLYSQLDRSLNVLDCKNGTTKQELVEGSMAQLFRAGELVFHHIGEDLLYIAVGSDVVYQIKDRQAKELFVLDYESKETSKALMAGNDQLSTKELLLYSPPRIHSIYKLKDNYSMIYTYQYLIRCCGINAISKQVLEDGLLIHQSNSPILMNNDNLIAWEYIVDNQVSVGTEHIEVSYIRPAMEEEDIAIVKYTLKK